MRRLIATVTGIGAFLLLPALAQNQEQPPEWLYPKVVRVDPKDVAPRHVPGSTAAYDDLQLRDLFSTIDWRPEQHPPMPPVVAQGRKPDVQACGYCHLATGQGRPESAPVAGLPVAYFISQLQAFASGKRHSSSSGSAPRPDGTLAGGRFAMNVMASKMTPDEMKAAADYFGALKYKPWIKVMEADTAPALTYITGYPIAHPDQSAEPLNGRIVEIADDGERGLLRDPDIGFTALVPRGSIARGEALVKSGGPAGAPCAGCHGAVFKGGQSAIAPPIAGRSPTYIARALYDFAHGSRDDPAAQVMKPSAARLSLDEMVAVAGYVGSLPP